MRGKGYQEGLIRTVLQRLEADQLLDDSEFAVQWIDNRQCFRPRSQRLMKLELRQKGLDERVIDALSKKPILKSLIWHFQLTEAIRSLSKSGKAGIPTKTCRALQRRGFSYDTVKECLAQLEQELSKPEGGKTKKWSS